MLWEGFSSVLALQVCHREQQVGRQDAAEQPGVTRICRHADKDTRVKGLHESRSYIGEGGDRVS